MTAQSKKHGRDKKLVLVVDDEMDMRIFLATLLEVNGYQPIVAKNGQEGIRRAQETLPALIVLDVMMPEQGGVLMYRALKDDAQLEKIPVVMLTAVGEKSFGHYLKMLDFKRTDPIARPQAFLSKPPEPKEILATITDLIG